MTNERLHQNASMPALLRHARRTYGDVIRTSLDREGFDDIPENGLYVIGSLAHAGKGVPISIIVKEVGISKQGAGQLVDTLVTRGYLRRTPDEDDRRQLIVTLTDRGHEAAQTQLAARQAIDGALLASVGEAEIASARRVLGALVELGRRSIEGEMP